MACRRSPVRARLAPLLERPPRGGLSRLSNRAETGLEGLCSDLSKRADKQRNLGLPGAVESGVIPTMSRSGGTSMRRLRRSLIGAAALAALATTPASAQVQVSQSGWLWGNPT